MSQLINHNYDYDGRPSVIDGTGEDPLFVMLMLVHGLEYARDLLLKDAAMREAAEQAARKPKAAAKETSPCR